MAVERSASGGEKRFRENTQGKENAHTHTYLGVYIVYIYITHIHTPYVCVYTSHGSSKVETVSGRGEISGRAVVARERDGRRGW